MAISIGCPLTWSFKIVFHNLLRNQNLWEIAGKGRIKILYGYHSRAVNVEIIMSSLKHFAKIFISESFLTLSESKSPFFVTTVFCYLQDCWHHHHQSLWVFKTYSPRKTAAFWFLRDILIVIKSPGLT